MSQFNKFIFPFCSKFKQLFPIFLLLLCVSKYVHCEHVGHPHTDCGFHSVARIQKQKYDSLLSGVPLYQNTSGLDDSNKFSDRKRSLLAGLEPQPIRFHLNWQLSGLSEEIEGYLRTQLVPAAVAILQNFIKVKNPVEGRLLLPRICQSYYQGYEDKCLDVEPKEDMGDPAYGICLQHATHKNEYFEPYQECTLANDNPIQFDCQQFSENSVGVEADFILYVTSSASDSCNDGAAAYAGFCIFDMETNRPLAGEVNFCPDHLTNDPKFFLKQVEVAVHEILHAVIFSDFLWERFIDSEGNKIEYSEVVRDDGGIKQIITPKVVEAAKEHFGCDSLTGVDLENEGGYGTQHNHWESKILQGELMDGMAGTSIDSERHVMSKLTLALLEDSGWYVSNYENAGFLEWGRNAGCDFLSSTCGDYISNYPNQTWFCNSLGETTCTHDLTSVGICSTDELMDDCAFVQGYSNQDCTNQAAEASVTMTHFGQLFSHSSRCIEEEGSSLRRGIRSSSADASCYNTTCVDGDLYVQILGESLKCPNGATIDLSLQLASQEYTQGLLKCPDNSVVCNSNACPNSCTSNGDCHQNQCFCYLGYQGEDCSSFICDVDANCPCKFEGNCTSMPSNHSTSQNPGSSPSTPHSTPQPTPSVQTVQIVFNLLIENPELSVDELKVIRSALASVLELEEGRFSVMYNHYNRKLLAQEVTITATIETDAAQTIIDRTQAREQALINKLQQVGYTYSEGSLQVGAMESDDEGEREGSESVDKKYDNFFEWVKAHQALAAGGIVALSLLLLLALIWCICGCCCKKDDLAQKERERLIAQKVARFGNRASFRS